MRQVLQYANNGEIAVADVPTPKLLPGCALVRTAASLVSAGTERAVAQFAGKNLFQKASARPDLVREVFNKVRRDGLFSAVQAVRSRLDQPLAVGYSSAGTVVAVHEAVTDIHTGDRVACAGAGNATHAEMACIPRLLMARIPNGSGPRHDRRRRYSGNEHPAQALLRKRARFPRLAILRTRPLRRRLRAEGQRLSDRLCALD